MKTLVLGASGATGRLVVSQLINNGISTKVLIRSSATLPKEVSDNNDIEIIKGNVNDYSTDQIRDLLIECDSVVSCLGHNISFKGIFGKPHNLVYNAVRKVTDVLRESDGKKKFILMSTTAYTDKIHGEKETFGESIVFALLKLLLPPHTDNVNSGDYLFKIIRESEKFEWIAIRPDSLIDETIIGEYEIVNMKKRSPIFDPGKTSRGNVAHLMVELLSNDKLWQSWKFKGPVIYNKE
ncbi:MAG: NAD(P)-binding oxidoreductase [Calditrichaceae bacterium]